MHHNSVNCVECWPAAASEAAAGKSSEFLAARSFRRARGGGLLAVLIFMALVPGAAALAEEPRPKRNVDGIMDNSFLVEEAYNQEAGVVQHIFTGAYGRTRQAGPDADLWNLSFTEEWPVLSQKHQFSYTLPYTFVHGGGRSDDGLGDVLLNYRYQLWLDETTLGGFSPRLSLILPTGNKNRGFGDDTVGGQVNLPFSRALGDKWFVHLNAGATFLPDAASGGGRDLWHYNLGASGIYAATPDLHFMLEWVGQWQDTLQPSGALRHEFSSVIAPGLRKAFNYDNGSQLVVGLAAPIGLTAHAPEVGVFLYLSFEHFFLRAK